MYFFMGFFGYKQNLQPRIPPHQSDGQQPFYIVYHYYVFPASKFIIGFGLLLVIFGWLPNLPSKRQTRQNRTLQVHRNPQYVGFSTDNRWLECSMVNNNHNGSLASASISILSAIKNGRKEAEPNTAKNSAYTSATTPRFIPRLKRNKPLS